MRRPAALLLVVWVGALAAGGETPRDRVDRILRQPAYQRWKRRLPRKERSGKSWGEQLRDTLDEWLKKLFRSQPRREQEQSSRPPAARGASGVTLPDVLKVLGYVIVGVVAVFVVFIVWRIIQERYGARAQAAVLSREQVREALDSGSALALDTPQWLVEAERLAREGDFRAVYRALYLALLSGLHSRGRIDFRRSRTNWTYVRRFRGEDQERSVFAALTERFDRVWYGLKQGDPSALPTVKRQVASLLGTEGAHG